MQKQEIAYYAQTVFRHYSIHIANGFAKKDKPKIETRFVLYHSASQTSEQIKQNRLIKIHQPSWWFLI